MNLTEALKVLRNARLATIDPEMHSVYKLLAEVVTRVYTLEEEVDSIIVEISAQRRNGPTQPQ